MRPAGIRGLALAAGLAVAAGPALAQTPSHSGSADPATVARLLDPVVEGRGGTVAVAVYSVERGAPLYLHAADQPVLPASNMKLYTTAAALDRLGPDYQFTTSLYADGPVRPDGTLDGSLILVGRGDPALSGRFYGDSATYVFDRLAEALARHGVHRVDGDLVGDASYFDEQRTAGGWEAGNLLWWYGARVSALSFNDNVVTLEIAPGERPGEPPDVRLLPRTDRIGIVNRVRTVGRRGGRSVGIKRRPDVGGYEVWGRIPVGSRPVRYVVAVEDPAAYALSVLRDRLARAGIAVGGEDRVVFDPDRSRDRPWQLLASHTSPRLIDLVRVVNKHSQNFFAEEILKTLGAVFRGDGSFSGGGRVVRDVVRDLGVPERDLRLEDGSGLSREDRTTARTTALLLVAMRGSPWFDQWYDSLLIAGTDGDPRRLDDPAAVGNVHAKTGTLRGVSALSGYVTTRDGELLAFSVMTNGLPGGKGASIAVEDAVAERLAGYSAWDGPDLQPRSGR